MKSRQIVEMIIAGMIIVVAGFSIFYKPGGPMAGIMEQCIRISKIHQWNIVFMAFFIKPTYMILSVLIALILRKNFQKDLVLIRWAMISFFLGEAFCATNYLITGGESDLLEILHGLGMVGMAVLLPWGILVMTDERVFHVTREKRACAFLGMCRNCWKQGGMQCNMKKIFYFMAPALAITALMPLSAPLNPFCITVPVWDDQATYQFSFLLQTVELRIYPLLGAGFMLLSLFYLKKDITGIMRAQPPFFIGFGFMGYALFRFVVLLYGYRGLPHWLNFWEEIMEFILILGILLFLFLFRKTFGLKSYA